MAPGRLSPAFRAPGATRLPAAVPDLELTVARQNVALGQEEQHAGQEADRPQRLRRSLHLAGARAHFRASRRDLGGCAEGGVAGRGPQAHCCWAPPVAIARSQL